MDSTTIQHVVRALFGLIILFAGRNIFWLFVGAIGFLVGFDLANIWLADQAAWLGVAVGVAAGLTGAILAVVFERVGFALAGFYAAVYLGIALSAKVGLEGSLPIIILAGGLAGAILAWLLTDWAIILLSALAGATAISSIFALTPIAEYASVLILATIGVVAQRRMLARRQHL